MVIYWVSGNLLLERLAVLKFVRRRATEGSRIPCSKSSGYTQVFPFFLELPCDPSLKQESSTPTLGHGSTNKFRVLGKFRFPRFSYLPKVCQFNDKVAKRQDGFENLAHNRAQKQKQNKIKLKK